MEAGLGRGSTIFPQDKRLTEATRHLLREGVYGDYSLELDKQGAQKRLVLRRGNDPPLPFMVWSAGQREFSPLLLGLYHLMPSAGASRRKGLKWVVLEEPEMGLHPKADTAVLFLVLELLDRGYRVCISTHSPHVLDMVWALRVMVDLGAAADKLLKLFQVTSSPKNKQIASSILSKKVRAYAFGRNKPIVDISRLDPDSPEIEENTWGGLTDFSARATDIVADLVANTGRG